MVLRLSDYKIHGMLNSREFKKEFSDPIKVVKKFEIPYLAGYSKDHKIIYIDKHMNTMMDNKIDITKFLVVHEKTEKALIDIFGLRYQDAHHIALHQERLAVKAAGIDWKKYEKFCQKYIKKFDKETLKNAPRDLDLTPYLDEKDYKKFPS